MKILRKTGKILLYLVGILLLLSLTLMITVQIPAVQTWLTQKAASTLSTQLNADVSVGGVDIDFFKTAVLEDIFIADQQQDTLLYAQKIYVDIGVFNLFRQELYLNKAGLEHATIQLHRSAADSTFNYQFIIDAFTTDAPKTDTTQSSWSFGLGTLALDHLQFQMADEGPGRFFLQTDISKWSIEVDQLDLNKQVLQLESLNLDPSNITFRQLPALSPSLTKPATDRPLAFPGIGWTLSSEEIRLSQIQLTYDNENSPPTDRGIDYQHVLLSDFDLSIDDFRYADDGIQAQLNQLSFRDHSGFSLQNASAGILITPEAITVNQLTLETPDSYLANTTHLNFQSFDDLTRFTSHVRSESDFTACRLAIGDLLMIAPALRQIESLKFPETEVLQLSGQLQLHRDKLELNDLTIQLDPETQLRANGQLTPFDPDPGFDLNIAGLTSSASSLQKFVRDSIIPAGLAQLGQFRLKGSVSGTLGDLQARKLTLTTGVTTRFAGDLQIRGLPKADTAIYRLQIQDLATRASDLKGFSKNPFPAALDSLGVVQFSGQYQGTLRDFDIEGMFRTGAGNASTDLSIRFNEAYTFASYTGQLSLDAFDLGKVSGDTMQVGKVTLQTRIHGEGLSLDTLNTTLDGVVEKVVFRDYEYHQLLVDGRFIRRQFEGNLKLDDQNLTFELSGKVNLNDSLPDLDLTLLIDTVNFKNLNLSEVELGLHTKLDARISGNNLDNLSGQASLSDLVLSGAAQTYIDPYVELIALQETAGRRSLVFRSGFTNARIAGQYAFGDLPDLLIRYVNDFFPVEALIDSTMTQRPEPPDQSFTFDFQFVNLSPVASIFLPGMLELDSSSLLTGSFHSAGNQLEMTSVFPNLSYQGNRMDSLVLTFNGNRKRLKTGITVQNLDAGGTLFAPRVDLLGRLGDDTLAFDLAMRDDSLNNLFRLEGVSAEGPDGYLLAFGPVMILAGEEWQIDPKNQILFSNNNLQVQDLAFRKNRQSIVFQSTDEAIPNDIHPIEVRFDNFRLREVSALLNNPLLQLEGGLSGKFVVREPRQNLHYLADVNIASLTLNENLLGDLEVQAGQRPGRPMLNVNTTLSGANRFSLNGTYGLEDNQFNLNASIGKLDMAIADPFLKEIIRNSKGYVAGDFTLRGSPDQPLLNGKLTTHEVNSHVILTGARYRIAENTLTFSENRIDLGQLKLIDAGGRAAIVTGGIQHRYFDNMQFDIHARTNGLQVLNTTRKDNPLYYGKLLARADVDITGSPDAPRLDVTATTLDSSLLHVEPLSTDLAVTQEEYIIFANPNTYDPDSLTLVERRISRTGGGFDLNLVLNITPDAVLNIIIDPLTGDELLCSGEGDFIVQMDPSGNVEINGTYVIDKGNYSFAYEGLVKRNFEIRKGSSLTFTGSPYDADFNITALYKTRTTTYELISNEATLNDAVLSNSKRRTDVEVQMKISGNLTEPVILFDIQLPENQEGPIDNIVSRKLATLRDEPSELNKQVFGLLFFNSFIQSETGAGLGAVGENTALKSVSGLINNQLNRLADRFIKGVDLTLGVESYKTAGQDASTVTELQLGLSKQLFNDRLAIRIGGNFNLENSQQSALEQGGYSAIAGDFVLEYKLNERGNYLLKVFHKSDYNILLDANTNKTGVGVMYRKSY